MPAAQPFLPSLLDAQDELPLDVDQVELAGVECALGECEREGTFTGARFFYQRPDAYRICVGLIAAGLSVDFIARLLRISEHKALAVARREPLNIAKEKESMARWCRSGAKLAWQILQDRLVDPVQRSLIETKDLARIAAQMTETSLTLAGEASLVVEHRVATRSPHQELQDYLDSLPNSAAGMGLGAQKDGPQNLAGTTSPAVDQVVTAAPGPDQVASTSPAGDQVDPPGGDSKSPPQVPESPANPPESISLCPN